MKNELVSAIITTYRRDEEVITQAIDSVIGQTYPNIEVIIVSDNDDASEYASKIKEIVSKYENIILIEQHESKGACIARNAGLNIAKGEYIAYLDDDDAWEKTKIEKQVKRFAEVDDDTAIVYSDYWICFLPSGKRRLRKSKTPKDAYTELLYSNYIGSTSIPMIRKSALLTIGGFDAEMQAVQELDVWSRLVKHYSVSYIDEPLGFYYFHQGEQITNNPHKRIAGWNRFYEKNKDAYDKEKNAFWKYTQTVMKEYVKLKDKKAIGLLWKMIRMCPYNWRGNMYSLTFLIGKNMKDWWMKRTH